MRGVAWSYDDGNYARNPPVACGAWVYLDRLLVIACGVLDFSDRFLVIIGVSFTDIREAEDLTGGSSCDSSIISLDQHPVVGDRDGALLSTSLFCVMPMFNQAPDSLILLSRIDVMFGCAAAKGNFSSLLFSDPSGANRTHKAGRNAGVLLRSNDDAVRTYTR